MSKRRPLSTSEVATLLGVSHRHVARLAQRGELRTVGQMPGLRGAWLFDATYIERLAGARAARREDAA